MEKKLKKFLKKYIILIWIIAVSLALTGFVVYSNYKNNHNVAKKVIASQAETDIRFSSNFLDESVGYDSTANMDKYRNSVSLLSNAQTPIIVDIRNYGKNNSTLFYPTDIDYTLDVVLTDSSGKPLLAEDVRRIMGNGEVEVKYTEDETSVKLSSTNPSHRYTRTLTHGETAAIDEVELYFPSTTTQICVKMIATPDPSHKGLHTLGAVFSVSDKSSAQGNGWTGRFNDSTDTSPSSYDLFNYVITGYGATDSATIKWDPAVFNLENIGFSSGITVSNTGTDTTPTGWSSCKKATISIGSNNKSQYSFRIHRGTAFDTTISTLTDSWETEMSGISEGEEGWISLDDYLWENIIKYLEFDDGI